MKRPTISDLVALCLVWLSKIGRTRLGRGGQREDRFYESFFRVGDPRVYCDDPRFRRRRAVILDFVSRTVGKDALVVDVGCGLGDVTRAIASERRAVGIERAAGTVRQAHRLSGGAACFVRASAERLPLGTSTADLCICLEVLEHVPDDASVLSEIHRVLRPSGWLIVAVPYTYYWTPYLRLMGHYRHYSRESLGALLRQAGFETWEALPNYPRWHQRFTRRFVAVRALHLAFGRLFGQDTVYDFRWPWMRRSMVAATEERLERQFRRDQQLKYDLIPTSTFLAARRCG